jgi:hypothetical protein
MRPWREAPSVSFVIDGINPKSPPFPSAPLHDLDENLFPICVCAVITTIDPPSKIVHQLAGMKSLCVCIVADEKSATVYDVPGDVVYLTPAMQVCVTDRCMCSLSLHRHSYHTSTHLKPCIRKVLPCSILK